MGSQATKILLKPSNGGGSLCEKEWIEVANVVHKDKEKFNFCLSYDEKTYEEFAHELFRLCDEDGNGEISFEEFKSFFKKLADGSIHLKAGQLSKPAGQYKCPVFGKSLNEISDNGTNIPYFWKTLFEFLSNPEVVAEEGILRIPGNTVNVNWHKQLFDEGREVVLTFNCHDATAMLKMYIRELPEQIVPSKHDAVFTEIIKRYENIPDQLFSTMKEYLNDHFPKAHKEFLRLLFSLLVKISAQSSVNMMNTENIIRCLAPTIGCTPRILHYFLVNYNDIF